MNLFFLFTAAVTAFAEVPNEFVSIQKLDPAIQVEMRYAESRNFIGRPIRGYKKQICYLVRPAAEALVRVQARLKEKGYGLKVYDCYRPKKAVADFAQWAEDATDTVMKSWYYPTLPKNRLFALGYIAHRSGHSRGATVDLTMVPLVPTNIRPPGTQRNCASPERKFDEPIDMGTNYDCFSPASHLRSRMINEEARHNRDILARAMESEGFDSYSKEWWHYTLKDEPFPKTYFDFDVE